MSIVVDNFLAHYGVKGMRWGVRRSSRSKSSQEKSNRWTEDQKRKLKTVGAIAAVGAIAVGAYYVSRKLNAGSMARPISSLSSLNPVKSKEFSLDDALKVYNKANQSSAASSVKKGAAAVKKVRMDTELSSFLSNSSKRMFEDQKNWSRSTGKALDKIIAEDNAFISDFMKNWTYVPGK